MHRKNDLAYGEFLKLIGGDLHLVLYIRGALLGEYLPIIGLVSTRQSPTAIFQTVEEVV